VYAAAALCFSTKREDVAAFTELGDLDGWNRSLRATLQIGLNCGKVHAGGGPGPTGAFESQG
jgi:hypothetical protein